MQIIIDDTFRDLIPPLSPDEFRQLEENILRDGCHDPLAVWRGKLLDGHHRYQICKKHGVEFSTFEPEDIEDEIDAQMWVIDNQLGKRNLNPMVASDLRGRYYELQKQKHGGDHKSDKSSSENPNLKGRTSERLAAKYNVNPDTIFEDSKFHQALASIAKSAGPSAKQLILSGEAGMNKKQVRELAAEKPDRQQFIMAVKKIKAQAAREHRQLVKMSDEESEEKARLRREAAARAAKARRIERFASVFTAIDRAVITIKSEATIEESLADWEGDEVIWLSERVDEILSEFNQWAAILARRVPRRGRLKSVEK